MFGNRYPGACVLFLLSDSQSGYIPLIPIIWRIYVDEREHLELLCQSRSFVADRHHLVYRRTIGAEKLVPKRPIRIITCMNTALMMENMFFGSLDEIPYPLRCLHIPMGK